MIMSIPAARSMAWYVRIAWTGGVVIVIAGLQMAQPLIDPYLARIVTLAGINIILAVSLNLINGYTGQFSIGHAGFMGVGAYVGAVVSVTIGGPVLAALGALPELAAVSLLLLLSILAGAAAAALMGLLVGLPSLRLRGDYLAIATLGFGEAIRSIIENIRAVGGAQGYSLPYSIHTAQGSSAFFSVLPREMFFWIFLFAIAVILFSRSIALSSHGRALFAIREDELAAESVGINAFRYKSLVFVLGAAWAGAAGVLLAHYDLTISPKVFGFVKSIEIVVMVVLGGMGSVTGAVIAAAVLTALPEFLRVALGVLPAGFGNVNDYRMVIYSLALVILMLTRPQGLFGRHELSPTALGRRILGRVTGRRS